MSTVVRDLNQARRVITKTPLLSLVAVLSLALGIAANTTVFSVVHSFLLRPLPYEDAHNVMVLWENPVARAGDQWPVSAANVLAWQDGLTSFEQIATFDFSSANLTGIERPQRIDVAYTSDNFFATLRGEAPLLGRTFSAGDGDAAAAKIVVLKEPLWHTHFGSDPSIIGRFVEIDGERRQVVGVMPKTFDFMSGEVDVWIPIDIRPRAEDRERRDLGAVGRLVDGVSVDQAEQEAAALAERLALEFPDTQEGWTVNVQTMREMFPGPTDSQLIKVLQGVALLVLLVACINVAGLLLAKADSRQKEMALRTALGAGRGRLLRLLMMESMVLAACAGLLGLGFAFFGVTMSAAAMPEILPANFWPRMDAPVMLFGFGVALLAGLVFGLGPALQAVRNPNLRATLGDGGRGGSVGRDRKRALSFFVMAELAMALAILVGASLLTDLFHNKLSTDPGFKPDGVLTAQLTLPEFRYPDDPSLVAAVDDFERRMAELSGVESVTLAAALPRSRALARAEMQVEGRPPVKKDEAPRVGVVSVTPSFFSTLQMDLLQGRGFERTDDADALPVTIVNRTFFDTHLADGTATLADAVGMRVEIAERLWTVVGVVPDYAQERLDGLTPRSAIALMPMAQRPVRNVYPILRTSGDPGSFTDPLRHAVAAAQPDQPVGEIQTLRKHMETELAGPTVISKILYGIGLLALVLAVMGIYGVMAFRIARQRQEIGIRMALGARPAQMVGRATGQGLRLAVGGLLLGVLPAAGVAALVQSIFEMGQSQGFTVAAGLGTLPILKVVALLAAAALAACFLPSLKTTRIDPQEALSAE